MLHNSLIMYVLKNSHQLFRSQSVTQYQPVCDEDTRTHILV